MTLTHTQRRQVDLMTLLRDSDARRAKPKPAPPTTHHREGRHRVPDICATPPWAAARLAPPRAWMLGLGRHRRPWQPNGPVRHPLTLAIAAVLACPAACTLLAAAAMAGWVVAP